ncbi:MAG TPA: DegT/DnrJ/EryC1/StrS family aminotransferase [Planctomycetes bacterium]|nr:DegT/DnrJ/EryC1/StrS family aminotransferase [Planctomycetota bacterium]
MSTTERIRMVAVGPDDAAEKAQWLEALGNAIDSNSFCLGAEVDRFESACKERLGVAHAFGVSSGTDGLKVALSAVGVTSGDEVIVPAYSFFSTASVIVQLGAVPIFCDLDPDTLCIDPAAAETLISSRTRAILPVHLYGQTADMDALLKIAQKQQIPIVEDAAQAFGVFQGGRPAGAIGDVGAFSFYPTKNLAAAGDAGMIVCQDDEIANKVRQLRVHGDAGGYNHQMLGWNARMDGFQGAILSLQLQRLDERQAIRQRNAKEYLHALKEHHLTSRVVPLGRTSGSDHCWHQFIVQVDDRDQIRDQLAERGIDSGIYYPSTLPQQSCLASDRYLSDDLAELFPVAQRAARRVLALPVHHRLLEGDPTRVIQALADLIGDRGGIKNGR